MRKWASRLRIKLEDVFKRQTDFSFNDDPTDEESSPSRASTTADHQQIFGEMQLVAEPKCDYEASDLDDSEQTSPPSRPLDPLDPLVFRYPCSTRIALTENQIFTNTVPRASTS